MPYTAHVAVGSYAVAFWCPHAAWLELGLLLMEALNAGTKCGLRRLLGPRAELLRRPEGAMDSGIYPQHCPRASTSSGMPSGHSQSSAFLATVFSCSVLRRWPEDSAREEASGSLGVGTVGLSLCYVWLLALSVMVSRTRFAGILAVRVEGRPVAHHTVLQVVVGAAIGCLLGVAAVEWHQGRSWLPWACQAALVVLYVALLAALQVRCRQPGEDSEASEREPTSDSAKSPDSGSSDTSTDVGSRASEVELPSRSTTARSSLAGYAPVRTQLGRGW
mmetsp:Transcript_97772/g.296851  ORF Transcript_97772/g.296851 Transcript_97772/m.296851 type:complete len:276 (+) Transcript_97772:2-829(+)